MPPPERQSELIPGAEGREPAPLVEPLRLFVVLDLQEGAIFFEWTRGAGHDLIAQAETRGHGPDRVQDIHPGSGVELNGQKSHDHLSHWSASLRAFINRLKKRLPVADDAITLVIYSQRHMARRGVENIIHSSRRRACPPGRRWRRRFNPSPAGSNTFRARPFTDRGAGAGRDAFAVPAIFQGRAGRGVGPRGFVSRHVLALPAARHVHQPKGCVEFDWKHADTGQNVARGIVRCTGRDELSWELKVDEARETDFSTHHLSSIRAMFKRWRARFPVADEGVTGAVISCRCAEPKRVNWSKRRSASTIRRTASIESNLQGMARALSFQFSTLGRVTEEFDPESAAHAEKLARKWRKQEDEEYERRKIIQANALRIQEQQRQKELAREQRRQQEAKAKRTEVAGSLPKSQQHGADGRTRAAATGAGAVGTAADGIPETAFPLADLRGYFLRERAAHWWVSNQSDDLLACRTAASSGSITRSAPRCACSVRCADAPCSRTKWDSAKPSRPGSCSRNCSRAAW